MPLTNVIDAKRLLLGQRIVTVVALVAVVSVGSLGLLGYVSVREWQRSARLLADRQADDTAERFLTDLSRDMQAAQRQVLLSPAVEAFSGTNVAGEPRFAAVNLIASALARYAYPDAFFLWHADDAARGAAFFYRRERRPSWNRRAVNTTGFPVVIDDQAEIRESVMAPVQRDAAQGRHFSIFEIQEGPTRYQVIARLMYRDPFGQHVQCILGFLVSLDWVRQDYFGSLLAHGVRIDSARGDVMVAIVDAQDRIVAGQLPADATPAISSGRRQFPLMFFNPLLVATDPPPSMQGNLWAVRTSTRGESSLGAVLVAADRMLLLQLVAVATLGVGILLTVRAAHANIRLANLRSEFIASVTHELKTPIATIQAAGETLEAERLQTADSRRQYAQFIVNEARRLTRLVNNLLAVSRATDAAGPGVKHERVSIDQMIREALDRFAVRLLAEGFTVETNIEADVPPVDGDPYALALLLDNIIDNAIRHARDTHRIEIGAQADGRVVVVTVKDYGGGIPADELGLVRKKFYRGRRAGHGGTGLGLAISERIALEHGGGLLIASDDRAGTTAVTIRLRVADPAVTESAASVVHTP